MTHYFDIHGWPEGLQDVADTSLVKPKGLPVDAGRLALVTEMHKRKTALFMDLINEGTIPLRPGVLAIVDEAIAADVPLAVCSTSNEAAKAAGMACLVTISTYTGGDDFKAADRIVDEL